MIQKIPAKGSEKQHFSNTPAHAVQIIPAEADCRIKPTALKDNGFAIRVYSGSFPRQKTLEAPGRFFQWTSEQARSNMHLRLENFLGGFTHYFNNLMMGIQGNFALMLLRKSPDDPHYERLKRIEDVIETESQMPLRLLDIAACGNSAAFNEGYFNDLKRFSDRRKRLSNQNHRAVRINEMRPAEPEEEITLIYRLSQEIICSLSALLKEIQDTVTLLSKTVKQGSRDHHKLKTIGNLVGKGKTMVKRLRRFAGKTENKNESIDLSRTTMQVIRSFEKNHKTIHFQHNFDSTPLKFQGNRAQILEALEHLLENAVDAQPDGGRVLLETRVLGEKPLNNKKANRKAVDFICIKISDTGIGMTPETCEQIFDPFFTAKKSCCHKGLGLCSVFGIVQKHSGHIVVNTMREKGTSIYLYFPTTTLKR